MGLVENQRRPHEVEGDRLESSDREVVEPSPGDEYAGHPRAVEPIAEAGPRGPRRARIGRDPSIGGFGGQSPGLLKGGGLGLGVVTDAFRSPGRQRAGGRGSTRHLSGARQGIAERRVESAGATIAGRVGGRDRGRGMAHQSGLVMRPFHRAAPPAGRMIVAAGSVALCSGANDVEYVLWVVAMQVETGGW